MNNDQLDELITGINKRFDSVDKRLDGIDKRFDAVDKRFDSVDKRLDVMDERFVGVDKRLDGMDERFDGIDNTLIEHGKTFNKMFSYISDVDNRMTEGFEDTASKDDLNRLKNTMDDFIRRMSDNNVEQASRDAQFARLVEWAREVSKKTGVPLPDL